MTEHPTPASDPYAGIFFIGPSRLMESLRSRHQPCTATRDLLGAVQTCELGHHNDSRAHRMTNPDGSVTTWRS